MGGTALESFPELISVLPSCRGGALAQRVREEYPWKRYKNGFMKWIAALFFSFLGGTCGQWASDSCVIFLVSFRRFFFCLIFNSIRLS